MVSRVASDCGVVVGSTASMATSACASTTAWRDVSDARVGVDRGGQRDKDGRVTRDVHHDDQGAVGARAEPVGDQVVGPALGARLRHRALVREAEPQRGHRCCEGEQQDRGADGVRRGVPADVRAPSTPVSAGRGRAAGPAPVDPVPGQPEQRGEQGDRGEHHHQHDQRDPDPTGGDERDPGDGQAEDRDDHGAAGEDDRAAGRGQRPADRVVDVDGRRPAAPGTGRARGARSRCRRPGRPSPRSPSPRTGCRRRTPPEDREPVPTASPSSAVPIGRPASRQRTRTPGTGSRSRPAGRAPRRHRPGAASNAKYRSPPASIRSDDVSRRSSSRVLRFSRSRGAEVLALGILDPDQRDPAVGRDHARLDGGRPTGPQGAGGIAGGEDLRQRRDGVLDPCRPPPAPRGSRRRSPRDPEG